jgi:starch synthase
MERAEAPAGQAGVPAGQAAGGDWWAAEVDVLPDAAVVNFVVQYYEHFDNNEGADFRAAVQQAGAGCARAPQPF